MSDEIDVEEGGRVHSRLGPSSMSRWRNCVGSPNLITKLGDKARKSGIEAAEGSAAHNLLETCLRGGEDAWEHLGEKITVVNDGVTNTFDVTQEMVDGVQLAIDWVRDKMAKFRDKGAILLVEQRVASPDDPEAFGTSDIIIIVPKERLIIADFKYGKGIAVEPDDDQTRSYGHYTFETFFRVKDVYPSETMEQVALSALFPDPNTVCELYIIQPRFIAHEKGPIRRHVTNKNELSRWFHGEVLPAMQDTRSPEATLTMGDWCKFCPASDYCPAIQRSIEDFNVGVEPSAMTDEQLNAACVKAKLIIKQNERNEREMFNRMMAGKWDAFADFKLVRKLADRIWKSGAEDTVALLGGDAYTDPELKSPAQIERMKGKVQVTTVDPQTNEPRVETLTCKDLVARFAMKPETGLTVAPRTDRREQQKSQMASFDQAQGVTQEKAA